MRFPGLTHLVILRRGCAEQVLNWTRMVMTRIGLTLNEATTGIQGARRESFYSLGYTFGPQHYRQVWPLVSGSEPVEEERAADQDQCGRPAAAQQCGGVGRSAGPAESDPERLVRS